MHTSGLKTKDDAEGNLANCKNGDSTVYKTPIDGCSLAYYGNTLPSRHQE